MGDSSGAFVMVVRCAHRTISKGDLCCIEVFFPFPSSLRVGVARSIPLQAFWGNEFHLSLYTLGVVGSILSQAFWEMSFIPPCIRWWSNLKKLIRYRAERLLHWWCVFLERSIQSFLYTYFVEVYTVDEIVQYVSLILCLNFSSLLMQ